MKLYLISQDVNNDYDTYDSAVVCAESEDAARMTHPYKENWDGVNDKYMGSWAMLADVKVQEIGLAHPDTEPGVVCASFNAG